ncbi:MFS transporter [Streptacidiphilus monticola]
MFRGYRALFSPAGAVPFALAALLARFPMGMLSLAATLAVTSLHGSYTLAGLGGATSLATVAVAGPLQARLVDRHGQARVSVPAMLLAAAGSAGALLTIVQHAPTWLFVVACAAAGLGPNSGSLARARWAHLHKGDDATLHTAYAYEGVVDELCFVLGPLAVMGLAAAASPVAAYVIGVAVEVVGILTLAGQRRTEPPVAAAVGHLPGSALRSPGMPALVLVLASTGLVFGAQEITTIGLAQSLGERGQAGWVLACYALGSCLSGLLLGLWRPRGSALARMRWSLAAMALSLSPLMLVHSLGAAAGVLFPAGFTTAPTMTTAMGFVRELVPEGS